MEFNLVVHTGSRSDQVLKTGSNPSQKPDPENSSIRHNAKKHKKNYIVLTLSPSWSFLFLLSFEILFLFLSNLLHLCPCSYLFSNVPYFLKYIFNQNCQWYGHKFTFFDGES